MKIELYVAGLAALLCLASSGLARASDAVVVPTAHPVPPDAVHVAPGGSDRHAGTRDHPLRTIAAALERVPPGGTVVLRAGIYREALGGLSKPVTLQPAPGETAWLKGSVVVAEWRREGDVWVHRGWESLCATCFDPGNIDPARPLAGRPEQVFVDGEPLEQVASAGEVRSGTFAAQGDRLVIGTDPAGRLVEASVHATALTLHRGAEGSRVRGLGFAHYASTAEPGLGGAVRADTRDLLFEGNTFAFNAVKGLSVFGADVLVLNNTFAGNGMMGLEAWRADGLRVVANRFAKNNREGFVQTGDVSEAAGAKITVSRGVTVTDNTFEKNRANGLWLDIDVIDATVVRNVMRGNARHGLFFEISARALIASNLVAENGVSGIALADATGARVFNNTLAGNPIAFLIQDDARDQGDATARADGNTWSTANHVFANNIVVGGTLFWVRDHTGRLPPEAMAGRSERNAYVPGDGPAVEWWRGGERTAFETFARFREATDREGDTLLLDAAEAPSGADPALAPESPARGAGLDLPRDAAEAIGVEARAPDLGVLRGPGGTPAGR